MHLIEHFCLSIPIEVERLRAKLFPFADMTCNLPWDEADAAAIWATSFDDPGDDYCELRVSKKGTVLGTAIIKGY